MIPKRQTTHLVWMKMIDDICFEALTVECDE